MVGLMFLLSRWVLVVIVLFWVLDLLLRRRLGSRLGSEFRSRRRIGRAVEGECVSPGKRRGLGVLYGSWGTYFITHGKPPVISRRSPEVGDKGNVEEVDEIEPSVEDEPSRLPMFWDKVCLAPSGKGEGVYEEEAKDDHDGAEDAPPELFVHHSFSFLFAVDEVFHRGVEGAEGPDVESC